MPSAFNIFSSSRVTQFHEASYVLFRRLAEGKLTHEEEKILKALGIKF
jgi:hypothetical protein